MSEKILKNLKETKEEDKMLKSKKRNYASSFGCNNSSTFDTSRSKHKPSIKQ